MTKYSYTLVVEDIEKSVAFYQQYFNWDADKKGKESAWINTQSPLVFSVVEKTYLYDGLGISEELPEQSFCTWLYGSEEELLAEKAELLRKGLVQIGALGHFLRDGDKSNAFFSIFLLNTCHFFSKCFKCFFP